jgi:multidrug efflux pump subunit AcrB
LLLLTGWTLARYPRGFVPLQDQRYLIVTVQLPDGTSVQRTGEVLDRIDSLARKVPGVTDTLTIAGMSLLYNANAPHWGSMFLVLDEYRHRRTPETSMLGIVREDPNPLQALEDGFWAILNSREFVFNH